MDTLYFELTCYVFEIARSECITSYLVLKDDSQASEIILLNKQLLHCSNTLLCILRDNVCLPIVVQVQIVWY